MPEEGVQEIIEDEAKWTHQGMVVPMRMRYHVMRYIHSRTQVGGFLHAVITNDLDGACTQADDENIKCIPAYIKFFYNVAPGACWGSPEAYENWISKEEEKP